jgi:hypothetical protein
MNSLVVINERRKLEEERIRKIVDLSRRRDRILEAPEMDLEALQALAADYEAAHMPCAAEELRRRVEWYRERGMIKVLN